MLGEVGLFEFLPQYIHKYSIGFQFFLFIEPIHCFLLSGSRENLKTSNPHALEYLILQPRTQQLFPIIKKKQMELENKINTVNWLFLLPIHYIATHGCRYQACGPITWRPCPLQTSNVNSFIVRCSFILHLFRMYDIANLAVYSDMIKTQFSFSWLKPYFLISTSIN